MLIAQAEFFCNAAVGSRVFMQLNMKLA